MTDEEVIAELRSDSPLNRARQKFSSACARIEQAGQQRRGLSPIEMRRMEFEAVREIEAAWRANRCASRCGVNFLMAANKSPSDSGVNGESQASQPQVMSESRDPSRSEGTWFR
jgi:hypothetical protein